MARKTNDDDLDSFPKRRTKKRGFLTKFLMLCAVGTILLIIFLPTLLTNRALLLSAIDRFAGIQPLKVDFESVQAGWFSPVTLAKLEIKDGDGNSIGRVNEVKTTKGLLSWITSSRNLGVIEVDGLESVVVVSHGTSNIEQLIQPFLTSSEPVATDDEPPTTSVVGQIVLRNAKVMMVENGRPEQWILQIDEAKAELPGTDQIIGPIELQANLGDVSGTVTNSVGTISAAASQVADSKAIQLEATLQNLPAEIWHIVHARLPEIQINEIQGRLSGRLSGSIESADAWKLAFEDVAAANVRVVAPELLGATPATLGRISTSATASLAGSVLQLENASLQCDFAQATANAQLPWPLVLPNASEPFIANGIVDARGTIDLPQLVRAASTFVPIRDGTELLGGNVQFVVANGVDAEGVMGAQAQVVVSGLKANASGQQLEWKQPLNASFATRKQADGIRYRVDAIAEFLNLQGRGALEKGDVDGRIDLDLLQQRLSQFLELPIQQMSGSADVKLNWDLVAAETVQMQGTLQTTPIVVVTATGGTMKEPNWNGAFQATARLQNHALASISGVNLELTAQDEKLTVQMTDTLSLNSTVPTPPAPFNVTLDGDLAKWKRRGIVWLSQAPQFDVAGTANVAVAGTLDLNHAEVLSANWRCQPLQYTSSQFSFSEPQMVGNFSGRVDTSDLTRLVIDKLQVQATSFSLGAQDSAAPDGNGRAGRAMFLVDISRLMGNVSAGQPANASTAQTIVSGKTQGQLQWTVSKAGAQFVMQSNSENFDFATRSPGTMGPQSLWNESTLALNFQGNWNAQTGDVQLSALQATTPWMNYEGTATYATANGVSTLTSRGQAVYDCAALSQKIGPMTGNNIQLLGQQTIPIDVNWTSSNDATAAALKGLTVATRLGWDQARVVGIEVGKADVPIRVDAGQLATAAEIPVSGGTLRWDIASDLTKDLIVINQKPMTVLENVAITDEMCKGWLKYVTPLIAEATSVEGRLSLVLDRAQLTPTDPRRQSVAGKLIMHQADVGPGPLSNQVIGLVKQIDAIRKQDFTQSVSSSKVWLEMPQQQIAFEMVDGKVIHRDTRIKIGDANISTAGSVDVSGQLELVATMPIPENWIEKSPWLIGMRGQSLQFPVKGTLKSPSVDAQALSQLGRQTIQNAAQGALQQGLSKGLGKLFGAPPVAPASPTPAQP